jgi:hypothetical protein
MLVQMICSNDGMVVVMGKGSRAKLEVEQLKVSCERSCFVIIVDLLLLPSSTPWIIQGVTQKYFGSSKVLDLGHLINQLQ